jgi:hypothetical protein
MKAFQSWIAIFRYKNFLRLNISTKFAPIFCQRIINKITSSYYFVKIIQSYVRRYFTQKRYWNILQNSYRKTEKVIRLQSQRRHQLQQEAFHRIFTLQTKIAVARLRLQCWFRTLLSQKKVTRQKTFVSKIQMKENKILERSDRRKLKSLMRIIQFYCVMRSCELTPLSNFLAKKTATQLLLTSTNLSLPSTQHSLSPIHSSSSSHPRPMGPLSPVVPLSPAAAALSRSALSPSSLQIYEHHYQSIKKPPLNLNLILKRVNTVKKGGSKESDFISREYHQHLFTLRQNGIFIYNPLTSSLKYNEVIYLIQNTSTLFLEQLSHTSDILQDLVTYFQGNKLILCGGFFSEQNFHHFITFLFTREGTSAVTIHFTEMIIQYSQLIQMSKCLSSNLCKLHELSVDVASVGILGICSLIVSLKV